MFSYNLLTTNGLMGIVVINIFYYILYLYAISLVWNNTKSSWLPDQRNITNILIASLVGLPPLPIFLTKIWTLYALHGNHTAVIFTLVTLLNVLSTIIYLNGAKKITNMLYIGSSHNLLRTYTPTTRATSTSFLWSLVTVITATLTIVHLV